MQKEREGEMRKWDVSLFISLSGLKRRIDFILNQCRMNPHELSFHKKDEV
jgi:hypothetical protein